jgi:hypothetical protein
MIKQPLFIIKSGNASVIFRCKETGESHEVYKLISGDVIGISDLL